VDAARMVAITSEPLPTLYRDGPGSRGPAGPPLSAAARARAVVAGAGDRPRRYRPATAAPRPAHGGAVLAHPRAGGRAVPRPAGGHTPPARARAPAAAMARHRVGRVRRRRQRLLAGGSGALPAPPPRRSRTRADRLGLAHLADQLSHLRPLVLGDGPR